MDAEHLDYFKAALEGRATVGGPCGSPPTSTRWLDN